jgi:hypothetical protein
LNLQILQGSLEVLLESHRGREGRELSKLEREGTPQRKKSEKLPKVEGKESSSSIGVRRRS